MAVLSRPIGIFKTPLKKKTPAIMYKTQTNKANKSRKNNAKIKSRPQNIIE